MSEGRKLSTGQNCAAVLNLCCAQRFHPLLHTSEPFKPFNYVGDFRQKSTEIIRIQKSVFAATRTSAAAKPDVVSSLSN